MSRKKAKVIAAARRDPSGPMWKDRIVGQGSEAPDQLLANPDNWRGHPVEQQNAVEELLERLGWVQRIIVNRRTGHVVDGHLRVDLAMRHGEEMVPVAYIDVSAEEERLMLATFDPSSAMAFADSEKLDAILGALPKETAALARALHADRRAVRKLVTFEAEQHFRIVVECADEGARQALVTRLTAEGYDCRAE